MASTFFLPIKLCQIQFIEKFRFDQLKLSSRINRRYDFEIHYRSTFSLHFTHLYLIHGTHSEDRFENVNLRTDVSFHANDKNRKFGI